MKIAGACPKRTAKNKQGPETALFEYIFRILLRKRT
jgi:hypothetical protein